MIGTRVMLCRTKVFACAAMILVMSFKTHCAFAEDQTAAPSQVLIVVGASGEDDFGTLS